MKFFFRALLLLLVLIGAYLCFWPTPLVPAGWTPEPIPELTGAHAATETLSKVDILYLGLCNACEDVAVDAGGNIYGGSKTGEIRKFSALSDRQGTTLASTGGRPLGLHFDRKDDLWVCDADRGLLKINQEGGVFTMVDELNGQKFKFTNDLDIGKDGMVYFTDASSKYGLDLYKLDLIEHRPYGKVMSYNPETKETKLIRDGLYFANGVAVSPEQDFVLVVETGAYRVAKIWTTGPKKGEYEIIIDNLPGYPDGISKGSNGIYWLTLISPRKALLEKILPNKFATKMIARLPNAIQPAPGRFIHILGINADGKIIHNLQGPKPKFAEISSVQEAYGQLFFGSLNDNGVGRMSIPR